MLNRSIRTCGDWRFDLLLMVLCLLIGTGTAHGQNCPPTDPCEGASGPDFLYYTTVEYYDQGPLSGRTVASRFGPAPGFSGGPERNDGDGVNALRRQSSASGSAGDGSFSVDIHNLAIIRNSVSNVAIIDGNGVTVMVDVYMKKPAGTPWVMTRRAGGQLTTTFPVGSGTSQAFYGSSSCSNNCAQTINESLSTMRGATTDERPPGVSACYSKAGTLTFDTNGWIFHSISFCFPGPCAVATYRAESLVNASMTINVDLPCTGTLTQRWLSDCIPHPLNGSVPTGLGVARRFEVQAQFQGLNGNSCSCCEYRQYVRGMRARIGLPFLLGVAGLSWESSNTNAQGFGMGCDQWVEDNGTLGSCTFPGYGHRDNTSCPLGSDTYGPDGCSYRGGDMPGGVTAVKYFAEFEGRVVLKPGCGSNPATREVVIDRQNWTVCCERGVLGVEACREGSASVVRPRAVSPTFALGDRSANVLIGRVGRVIVGALSISTSEGETITAADIPISVDGAQLLPSSQHELAMLGSSAGQSGLRFFAFASNCVPSSIVVRSAILPLGPSARATTTLDITSLASPLADLDDGTGTGIPDRGVTIEDLLYFLSQYQLGSSRADLDDGSMLGIPDGGVTIDDLLLFLEQFAEGC